MDILVLIGRVLFAVLFLGAGINHVTQSKAMGGYAASKGVPAATIAVFGSGVLLLAGSLSVLLGIWADLGSLLLIIFLVPTAVLMHPFWKETGDARQLEMSQFLKDVALAGAALMLLAFFSYTGSKLGLTITGPLFNIS
jgi:putative oxidoreductase